ncbi:MAG: hypothetical protein J0I43_15565 [Microbacterium sp.]|uniref:hypothetical protein n=1 Tax=Microbacterium sp. TaxID=51671 RepID=UPI001ACDF2BD|nr:hypothetical protein [Microbacterium sp.]MBN9178770.1 hypothetical protein [Microbacterium sp.]
MSWLFDGLPLHPLFVHAAVIAVPVVALLAIAAAWVPKVRDWLGIVFPILATPAFIAAFLTKQSGEALATQVSQTAAVTAHTEIADIATVGAFLLFAGAWAQWVWLRFFVLPRPGRPEARVTHPRLVRAVSMGVSVLLTLVGVFAIVAIVIVGDTGARAVWE